jgi:hypothetical protein
VQKSRGSKPNQGVNASNIKVVQLLDGKLDLCHIEGVTKLLLLRTWFLLARRSTMKTMVLCFSTS